MAHGRKRACPRCGVTQERRKDFVVCSDCKSVLTAREWAIWAGAPEDIESSHGTEQDQAA